MILFSYFTLLADFPESSIRPYDIDGKRVTGMANYFELLSLDSGPSILIFSDDALQNHRLAKIVAGPIGTPRVF